MDSGGTPPSVESSWKSRYLWEGALQKYRDFDCSRRLRRLYLFSRAIPLSIESGESIVEAAKRELLEETGLVATEWKELGEVYLSNSVSDEKAVIYLAQNLSQHQACPEETEILKIRKLPLKDAIEMAKNGEITDALSVLSLLKIPALHLF